MSNVSYDWEVDNGTIIGPNNEATVKVIWAFGVKEIRLFVNNDENVCSTSSSKIITENTDSQSKILVSDINVDPRLDTSLKQFDLIFDSLACISESDNYEIEIISSIRASIFLPIQGIDQSYELVESNKVITTYIETSTLEQGEVFASISGYVLIADVIESSLDISSVTVNGTSVLFDSEGGKISLEGLAENDGYRLLNSPTFNIQNIYPNPANEKIELLIASNKEMKINIQLIDVLGISLIDINKEIVDGANQVMIEIPENVKSASYKLLISSGNNKVYYPIMIMK